MLVSKNPYVVEARPNPAPKSPHLAPKTGEKFTQTYRLNSLIFIVEKYRNKLLFGFLRQKYKQNAFASAGCGFFG